MNNKTILYIMFIVAILLAVALDKEESPILKHPIITLIVGFIIASIGIFSWHAYLNGGYDIFLVTDTGFWPFVGTALGATVLSAVLAGILWLISIFAHHLNVTKVWTILTIIVEALFLFWQYHWVKSDIIEENERTSGD